MTTRPIPPARPKTTASQFVICIQNDDYPASLEKRKIYQTLPDAKAERHHLLRVIDESGEDYLYPADYFLPIRLSQNIIQAFASAA